MQVPFRVVAVLLAGSFAMAGASAAPPIDAPAGAASAAEKAEPKVEHLVNEDDNVRIEELRVRGETQSITVKSKLRGAQPYQIVPSTGARDPSQAGQATGQSHWHVLSF